MSAAHRASIAVVLAGWAALAGGVCLAGCASNQNARADGAHVDADADIDADIDPGWLLQQGIGQAELLLAARPVAPLLTAPDVDRDIRRRLLVATQARDFARDRLGLNVTGQYERVVFLSAPAVVNVVSAAPRDALTPRTWHYPVVGALPYRGHFSLEDAEAEADALERAGFDVSVRPVSTYSLLGIAPDPIVSSMLWRRDDADIVETVIHELAHATVFSAGQGAFNEGLATFIGREGRRQFIIERFGPTSSVARRADAMDDDDDAWSRAVSALAFDLRVLFAQRKARSPEALAVEKQRIFARHQAHWEQEVAPTLFSVRLRAARLPENNAELAAVGIYSLKQELYQATFDACGGDWRCFLEVLREVSSSSEPEVALAEREVTTRTVPLGAATGSADG